MTTYTNKSETVFIETDTPGVSGGVRGEPVVEKRTTAAPQFDKSGALEDAEVVNDIETKALG